MTNLVLDAVASRVRIHTFAEGLFARLAHDLALECSAMRGTASRDGTDAGKAEVEIPLSGIAILGVLHGDRIDERGLSPSDRHDALEKMRREVFHADADALVKISAVLEGGASKIVLTPPNGRPVTLASRPMVRETPNGVRVSGAVDLSLTAIGSDAVKGPMGAFKVKDRVEVRFDVVFVTTP